MPDHEWTCSACGEKNPPYTEACRDCYTFADPKLESERASSVQSAFLHGSPDTAPQPEPSVEPSSPDVPYVPNEIPFQTRARNIFLSLALIAYGTYGLWINDLYVPGKHGRGIHFHGIAAEVMYTAFLSGCLVLLSAVVDHYDRRNNELQYKHFSDGFRYVGIGLFAVAAIIQLVAKP